MTQIQELTKRQHELANVRTDHQHTHHDYLAGSGRAKGPSYRSTFEGLSGVAIDLLAEAKLIPAGPRTTALLAYLSDIVSRDAAAADAFNGHDERLAVAQDAYDAALEAKHAATAAFARGTLDAKEAAKLWAVKIAAEAVYNLRDTEALALLEEPAVPVSAMPAAAFADANAQTEELVRFHSMFGVVFEPGGDRPAIDVIAIARRLARECSNPAVAALWLVSESRALAGADEKQAAELARVFAERSDLHAEIATYGGMAR